QINLQRPGKRRCVVDDELAELAAGGRTVDLHLQLAGGPVLGVVTYLERHPRSDDHGAVGCASRTWVDFLLCMLAAPGLGGRLCGLAQGRPAAATPGAQLQGVPRDGENPPKEKTHTRCRCWRTSRSGSVSWALGRWGRC